ncbi:CRE-MAU-2 protein [Caenorhabditis remanei]|uniref:Cohesin loading complex subunit SCC4 homolog n=1 Tax=Caenorhabditis remanei TaxID=31234 RepID=E3MT45_CAERE|nr:CRE-MAU-2 protein [Caenorhabditis remanei]
MSQNEVAKALLGMAEALRTQEPPKLKMAIKCARSSLTLQINDEMQAICNLQLGKLLFFYTENSELAKTHLQIAYDKMLPMGTFYTRDRMHAISMIADLYIHYQHWPIAGIKSALRHEISTSRGYPVLTNKLMFQLIEILKIDKDVEGAFEACQIAINSSSSDPKMELYFRITRTLVNYQLMHEESNATEIARIGSMIKSLEATPEDRVHLECIKDFYVCTKLAYMFYEGKSRTSRQLLRQIQKSQTSGETKIHGIRWLGETSMTLFACVMNIISALVQSNPGRVEKYYHLVVKHADEIIYKSTRTPQEPGVVRCINMIKMTTLEMMACCNVMACRPQKTLVNVRDMLEMCHRSSGPLLYRYFAPHIQYVLGLQCCYFRQHEYAEKHFISAINLLHLNDCTSNNSMALLNLNLAMTYLNQLKMADYYEVAEKLTAPKIAQCSQMLKSNVKLLSAFFSYLTNKPNECKTLVHEVLDDSKAEDFFRLHGLALLLMSLIFPVDEKGVKPTVDWSKKSHDHVVIMWSHHLYERIIRAAGVDPNSEQVQLVMTDYEESRKILNVDYLVPLVNNMSTVKLLQWFEGDPFKLLPRDEIPM